MNVTDVEKLSPGNEVLWTDPDGGVCTMTLKIITIDVAEWTYHDEDVVVRITGTDTDGGYHELECFTSELS